VAVRNGKPKIRAESVPDIVAIEDIAVASQPVEAFFDAVGDGGLAGAREPGEPGDRAAMAILPLAMRPVDVATMLKKIPGHSLSVGAGE